jgi:hypothetical protein
MPTQADVDAIRTLTGLDTTALTDQAALDLLNLNDGALRLAAADALEVHASRLESMSSDDVSVDGSKRAAVLLKRADRLRELHEASDDGVFFFDGVFDGRGRPELTPRECF